MTGSRRLTLRERLRAREPLSGLLLKLPCLAEVELAAGAADLVVFDLEHGPRDDLLLAHHLRAATAVGLPALVRVASLDAASIGSVLDAGAQGVVIPHVEDLEQATAAVRAARYPPEGSRGWARSTRAARYGRINTQEHLAASEATCVVLQLESVAAAEIATAVARTPGVDALFPGAADIAAGLGDPTLEAAPEVADAVDAVLAAARDAGRGGCAVARDPRSARALQARGATVLLGVSTSLIATAFDEFASWSCAAPSAAVEPGDLVLIAGMLETEAVWSRWLDRLDGGWRPRPVRIDLDTSVTDMAESVLALAPEQFVLAGHSLGGVVALEVLELAPERVRGAVLVSAPAQAPRADQLVAWDRLERQVVDGGFAAVASAQPGLVLGPQHHEDEALRALVTEMALRLGADGLLRQLQAQRARRDHRAGLGSISCPVLVLSGADDAVCPPKLQQEVARGISGAEHITVAGAGHLLPAEAPEVMAHAFTAWAAGQ